jgi:glycosyltransferase involved in cell wall biosynthesis
LPILLEAFKRLQTYENNVCLVIAGAVGGYSNALQKASGELKYLRVLTDISQQTKCRLLQSADAVVLPSKEESFGVVFLEAWSFQKPLLVHELELLPH